MWLPAILLLVVMSSKTPAAEGYLGPSALAVSCDAQHLLVACADACQVLWVTLPSGEVTRRVNVPSPPTGLILTSDDKQLIVTCAAVTSTVLVFDVQSGRLINDFAVGHTAVSPVLSHDGQRLYVCNRFSSNVSVIDMTSGTEVARIPAVREPIAAAITPDGKQLLVANHLPNTRVDSDFGGKIGAVLTVIDTDTYDTTAIDLPNGSSSVRGICVTPDGNYAFVTHLLSNFENVPFRVDMGWINVNVTSVIDLREMRSRSTIGLDELHMGSANPWGVACNQDGTTVCVASSGTHELSVITTSDLVGDVARRTMSPLPGAWPVYPSLGETLWQRIALPGKGPRAVAVSGSEAYVAEYYSDAIAIVDLARRDASNVRSIALGPPPSMSVQRRGQLLFDDATICYQNWQSCSSCHPDGRSDCLNWDLMNDGIGNPKNSKSMLLSHQTPPSMAKGVRATAEIAVRSGLSHILFAHRPDDEAEAIDAYLRSLQPAASPHLKDGELSAAARRGAALFESERVGCHRCHPAPLFTDLRTHRMGRTNSRRFENLFDTPTLVEIWRTAPYLHDGQYATMKELLTEGRHGLKRVDGEELREQEIDDLVEYVLSL